MTGRLEIPFPPMRLVCQLVIMLILGAYCCHVVLADLLGVLPVYKYGAGRYAVLAPIGLAAAGYASVAAFRRLCWRGPGIEIDEIGIRVFPYCGFAKIAWNEMVEVRWEDSTIGYWRIHFRASGGRRAKIESHFFRRADHAMIFRAIHRLAPEGLLLGTPTNRPINS